MSVQKRLSNIETTLAQFRQTSRCAICRDWPSIRLTTIDAMGRLIEEDRPPRCPGCGFESDARGLVRSIEVHLPNEWSSTA